MFLIAASQLISPGSWVPFMSFGYCLYDHFVHFLSEVSTVGGSVTLKLPLGVKECAHGAQVNTVHLKAAIPVFPVSMWGYTKLCIHLYL